MCGIAGIYNFDGKTLSLDDLKTFAKPISHRGPDAEGFDFFHERKISFAHKRLSILDISDAGAQPMQSADNQLSIVFNGEIFNFIELRNELKSKGYAFRTNTDTEVILIAYQHWGHACFNKFNGMWAMAIYHKSNNSILLCRDRFGIKPLYFKHYGNFFAFASETNCFANIKNFPRSFNHDILTKTLDNPNYAASIQSSIFEGIMQVKPGCYMTIDEKGFCEENKYYHFEKACAEISDITYQTGDFFDLFEDAVKIRLRSDVPIATAFSGGLDSTAVFSMVQYIAKSKIEGRLPKDWQKAFCMEFKGELNNDAPFAVAALKEMGLEADFIQLGEENISNAIINETTYFDDIIGTPISSITGIYRAMKNAGYTVSLDGHGADEYLFGYRDMVNDLFYNSLKYNGKKSTLKTGVALLNMYHKDERLRVKKRLNQEIKLAYQNLNYFKRLWRNTIEENEKDKEIVKHHFFINPLPALLKNFDKASMLSGVEVRMPFMDYRLVEMCYNLPIESKINKGHTKWIVKDELKNIMPKVTLDRTYKIGIGAPLQTWLGNKNKIIFDEILMDGPNKEFVPKEILNTNDIDKYWKYLNLQLIKL